MLKNGEGGYVADEATLDRLEGEGRVVVRYLDDNPNGSLRDIAGITNESGNVVGLMPHPEHAVEALTGSGTDGLGFFTSLAVRALRLAAVPASAPAGPQRLPRAAGDDAGVGVADVGLPVLHGRARWRGCSDR